MDQGRATVAVGGAGAPGEVGAVEGPFRIVGFGVLVAFHLVALSAIWTGVTWRALALCGVLYLVRMFGVTAGYHRYFAHRSFETGRVMRVILGLLAVSTLQRKISWWAAVHRDHHRFSDRPDDVHSPVAHGLARAHLLWVFHPSSDQPVSHVNDLRRMPEVVWIDRLGRIPFAALGVVCWLVAGWSGVIVGLLWSTLLVYHATMAINSMSHLVGSRRYETSDQSRNNWVLALLTLGEGWHNNHHHYPSSTRQGFFWWEIDLTWIALKGLEKVGLVWGLREPPASVMARGR